MSYILIILAVLALLNTYPLLISQSLVFQTKETAMKSSVKMVESALSGLPELTEIARRQLEKLCARAGSHGLALSVEPGAAEELARQALSSSGGAREIRHLLQTCVQTPLADALLSDTLTGNRVVAVREGKLVVTTRFPVSETGK